MRHLLALLLCCFANLATAQTNWTTPGGSDPDSFGRSLTYLGQVSTTVVNFAQACNPGAFPAPQLCVQVPTITDFSPAVGFEFDDLGSIVIPGGSTHSTIWPFMTTKSDVGFVDPVTHGSVHATLMVSVIITMESSVLNDPTIIDPSTGLPANGKLITSFAAPHGIDQASVPFLRLRDRSDGSGIGAFTSAYLREFMTKKQIANLLKNPITLRIGLSGQVRSAQGYVYTGVRVMGD